MRNRYKVPKKQWKKWTGQAQSVFNEVHYIMINNQPLFLHPKAEKQMQKHWKTTAYNAAWIAADSVNGVKV